MAKKNVTIEVVKAPNYARLVEAKKYAEETLAAKHPECEITATMWRKDAKSRSNLEISIRNKYGLKGGNISKSLRALGLAISRKFSDVAGSPRILAGQVCSVYCQTK